MRRALEAPGVVGAGLQQFLDAVLAIDRHDFVAHVLGHRVERDREVGADFLAAARHHRHHAAGRKRDAALRQGKAVAVHHQLERVADVIEIVQRLAHAHHHDVGQQAAVGSIFGLVLDFGEIHLAFGPFAQRVARQHDLADDLARGQVAHQPHRAGMAEPAVERAADLRGNAQRSAIRIGDEDHFEIMPVGGAQQPLARAVARMLRLDDLGATDHEPFGQPWAHRLGDVGHRREIGYAAVIEPVEHLFGTQPGLFLVQSGLAEQFAQALHRQADDVDPAILARRDVAGDGDRIDLSGDRHEGSIGHGVAHIG